MKVHLHFRSPYFAQRRRSTLLPMVTATPERATSAEGIYKECQSRDSATIPSDTPSAFLVSTATLLVLMRAARQDHLLGLFEGHPNAGRSGCAEEKRTTIPHVTQTPRGTET
jgi:hypothetical protein